MSSAAQRTDLLHRMLLVRHFAEQGAAVPLGGRASAFRVGEEAMAAGAWAALGPGEVVLRPEPDESVMTVRLDDGQDDTPTLICHLCAEPGDPRAETVDGLDVEAVLVAAQAHLHALRAGQPAEPIELCTGVRADHPDPIDVLTARMFADHQLDDNALHAIDRDAASRVTAALARR